MNFVFLQKSRVLQLYPGVVYEFDLIGGYGYAVLMRKYDSVLNCCLLLVLPGIFPERPLRLEKIFKPLLMLERDCYYMMFFPVSSGLRRGLFRSVGIVRGIEKWSVPCLPQNDDLRRIAWYWHSGEEKWSYMPSDVSSFQFYRVSSVAILRMLKGLHLYSLKRNRNRKKRFHRK